MGLLRFLFLAVITLGGLLFIVYQIFRFALSISGSSSQLRKDAAKLREELKAYSDKLVPLTEGELELLSLNQVGKSVKRRFHKITKGMFTSIYHEPLLAYAHKAYNAPGNISVLLVKTHDDEYFYYSKGDTTRVFLNSEAFGVVRADGKLYSPNEQNLLAHIEVDNILENHPVFVGERELGNVINPGNSDHLNPRAFHLFEKMDKSEKEKFLALTFLSLVEQSVE